VTVIPPYNEPLLLQAVSRGDEKAFEQLFHYWHQRLGAFVIGWTKSEAATEEIVQDVFLKVWLQRAKLAAIENFGNYLFILSRNHTYNALRQTARERQRQMEWLNRLESTEDIVEIERFKELTPLLEEAVQHLPEQQRKVYLLRYKESLKYEEIGEQLQISPETARKHLQLATKFISTYIKAHHSILVLIFCTPLILP
jgi:RNA polymerase sigma-70 factor (family 1)